MYGPTADLMKEISVDPIELFVTIVVILGIPLIIGMFVNNKFPDFTKKIMKTHSGNFCNYFHVFYCVCIFEKLYHFY
jgi:predicted Na+-dependent transporter